MARVTRSAVEIFAVMLEERPRWMIEANGNDNYVSKDDLMGEWTTIPSKLDNGTFALRFIYRLQTPSHQPDQWVQMKTRGIQSIEAQGDYVILNLKYKKDHVNLHMHYQYHTFSYQYAVHNTGQDAKHFELTKMFKDYNLSALWTARKLNQLLFNMTKYNTAVEEANKKKNSPRKPFSAGAGGSRGAPRTVPSGGRINEAPSRISTPSKRSRDDMEKSRLMEGVEASSAPIMPTPLKKRENPDVAKATKILWDFKNYSKDCWPMGRHFTFSVNCFKCEKSPNKWVVRSQESGGINWQINNLMNKGKVTS